MQVVGLSTLLDSVDKGLTSLIDLQQLLYTFESSANEDVQNFLHKSAITSEKQRFVRTFLVVDNNDVVGYFSLCLKSFHFDSGVTKTKRGELTRDRNADQFATILIAQLGRSDKYRGKVPGKEILQRALINCNILANSVGRIYAAIVEYDNILSLHSFYTNAGFKVLQTNPNKKVMASIKL